MNNMIRKYDFLLKNLIQFVEDNKKLTYELLEFEDIHETMIHIKSKKTDSIFTVKLTQEHIIHWENNENFMEPLNQDGEKKLFSELEKTIAQRVTVTTWNDKNEWLYQYIWLETEPLVPNKLLEHIVTNVIKPESNNIAKITVHNFLGDVQISYARSGDIFKEECSDNEKK